MVVGFRLLCSCLTTVCSWNGGRDVPFKAISLLFLINSSSFCISWRENPRFRFWLTWPSMTYSWLFLGIMSCYSLCSGPSVLDGSQSYCATSALLYVLSLHGFLLGCILKYYPFTFEDFLTTVFKAASPLPPIDLIPFSCCIFLHGTDTHLKMIWFSFFLIYYVTLPIMM